MGQYQHTFTQRLFRMGWLTVCLLGVLLVSTKSMPVEEEIEDQDEIRELFTRLFIEGTREGRDLEVEIDNTIEDEDEGENKAIEGAIQETNSQEISRFNNYIDAIYKRMNAALRAKLMDPMVLNLQGKDKKEGNKKKVKDAKKRVDRDVEDEEDIDESVVEGKEMEDESEVESEVEIDHRAGEPKQKQKGNKKDKKEKREKNKNKKGKDKTKKKDKKTNEEKEQKKSLTKKKRQENKLKAKKEREQAKKEREEAKEAKKLAKAAKADKKAAKAARKNKDQARESRSREHGGHHNKKKKEMSKGRNGEKAKEKKGKKDSKNNNKKGKGSKDKKGSKGSKGSKGKARDNKQNEKESKVMGSLAGIATLRRSGDVTVMDDENHKKVESSFTVGPLMLEVSKTIGQGRSRTVRTAKATTDVMTGHMVLKVKPDGSAHVLKVVFSKPDHVDVQGSLSDNKPRSITYLKNSVNRMRPIAAQKILKTARYVLKAPATVKQ